MQRDNRTILYGAQPLDPSHAVVVDGNPETLKTYPGQCAAIVLANLLSRMTPSVSLSLPNCKMHPRLRFFGDCLHEVLIRQMKEADPTGKFLIRARLLSDYVINIGAGEGDIVATGVGWTAYAGPSPVPFVEIPTNNPMGSIFAAILAAAQLFVGRFPNPAKMQLIDTFTWTQDNSAQDVGLPNEALGRVMTVGVGSVGSAALYFLALARASFSADLIDYDFVEVLNLGRSPIFTASDAKAQLAKVDSVKRFLSDSGISDIRTDCNPLHESSLWTERLIGEPDVLISAANEMDVRRFIENTFPPLQLYATTGRNWQVALVRHVPMVEPCSTCLFPSTIEHKNTACSSVPGESANSNEKPEPDVALPFLSFAAGFMIASELLKLHLANYPIYHQRVTISFRPDIQITHTNITTRNNCMCTKRSHLIHSKVIEKTKYCKFSLSDKHSAA